MSTSIIYHARGIYGYDFFKTSFEEGGIIFQIAHKAKNLRCSVCNSTFVSGRGTTARRFRSLPVGSRVAVGVPDPAPPDKLCLRVLL